ncbi:MAG: hypothetical protein V3T77_02815, partial [Planctomycetota bacterium]
YKIRLKAPALLQPKTVRGNLEVTLNTSDGKSRTHTLPVTVQHLDRIMLTPRGSIIFPRTQTEKLIEQGAKPIFRDVYVYGGRKDVNFQLKEAKIENAPEGLFAVEVTPVKEGFRYRVRVTLNEYRPERSISAKLLLVTDQEDNPNREMRIFAQFGKAIGRERLQHPKHPVKPAGSGQ